MTDADHIKAFRLFELARAESSGKDFQLTDWEKEHLSQCAECRGVVDVFSTQFKGRAALAKSRVPIRRFNTGECVEIVGPGPQTGKRGFVTEVIASTTGDFIYRYRVQF